MQRFCLLHRLRLSVFDKVYNFSSGVKAKDWIKRPCPAGVLTELLADAALMPFGCIDMTMPHLSVVGATDASSSYGHGAAVAHLATDQVRLLSRLSTKAGDFAALDDGPCLDHRAANLGPRHNLGLSMASFEVVLCARVLSPGHINVEEAKALLSYVRWLLRSGERAGHRVIVLLDSKVVVGAVAKGRSSSWPLNQVIRGLAAMCFAGGLRLNLVFIPTEHNPSDHPSRGGPATWPSDLKKHRRERLRRAPPTFGDRLARLRGCGTLSSSSAGSSSSCP